MPVYFTGNSWYAAAAKFLSRAMNSESGGVVKVIKLPDRALKKDLQEEWTVDIDDVTFVKYLPTCPKCKLMDNVSFNHVTRRIYECGRCNLLFRLVKKTE
jgi:ribosomal protein S27AE